MTHIYMGAVAFGVTLLVASLVMSGHDGSAHGGHVHAETGLGWAPVTSLRFWVFFFTFGGGAGLALEALGSSELVSAIAAGVIGWLSGALAVAIIGGMTRRSVSSEVKNSELVGVTGTLMLPAGPDRPGKVRLEVMGRAEDFVATVVPDGGELPTGTLVLVVAEADPGTLLVAKHEV